MMKRILAILLVVAMLSSSAAFASTEEYTINELVSLMEAYNRTIKISDINVKKMEMDLHYAELNERIAEVDYKDAKDSAWAIGPMGHYSYLLRMNHVLPQVQYGMFATSGGHDMTVKSLENNFRMAAMGAFSKQEGLKVSELKLKHALDTYEKGKLQYSLGVITDVQLLQIEADHLSAEVTFKKATRDHYESLATVNQLMGLDLDKSYNIVLPAIELYEYTDASELLVEAKKNNFNLNGTKMQIENLNNKLDFIVEGNYVPFSKDLKKSVEADRRTLESLDLKLRNYNYDIEKDLLIGLESLHNLQSQYDQLGNTITIQKNNLNAMKAQNKQGYVTDAQMKTLEFAIMDLEANYKVLGFSYNNKVKQIENFLSIGSSIL